MGTAYLFCEDSSVMDSAIPEGQGLYDPANEHDACGVGFVAHIRGKKSHSIVDVYKRQPCGGCSSLA